MGLIDTRSHYIHKQFNKDRDIIINRLLNTELDKIIECGTNTETNEKVLTLCNEYDGVYGTVGYAPTNTNELENNPILIDKLKEQLFHKKIVAIGNIGLDYYCRGNPELQKKWFVQQLKLANELNIPVCIYSRSAEKDTLNVLQEYKPYIAVMQNYSYGIKAMNVLLDLGFYFSIGGACTYRNNTELKETIKEMPLNRIVLETECPFLTPLVFGRQRNDSSKLSAVVKEIARIKKISIEEVIEETTKNANCIFNKFNKEEII